MWNYASVYGGRVYLNNVVRDLSDRWRYLESESAIMF